MIIDVSLLLLKLLGGCKYKIYNMATSCQVVPFKVKTYMTYVHLKWINFWSTCQSMDPQPPQIRLLQAWYRQFLKKLNGMVRCFWWDRVNWNPVSCSKSVSSDKKLAQILLLFTTGRQWWRPNGSPWFFMWATLIYNDNSCFVI